MAKHFLSLAISVSLPFFSVAGCKERDGSTELKDTATQTIPGIAKYYFGVQNLNNNLVKFENGHSVDFFSLTQGFQSIPGTGGMATTSPRDMEKLMGGPETISAGTMCAAELIGTGRLSQNENGIGVSLVPLNNGQGMTSWNPQVPALPATGTPRPTSDGPPTAANTLLAEAEILASMKQVKSELSFSESNFRDCLKNPKAAGWADISAHYYCIYPYTIRYCYSSILAETRNPVEAFKYCSDPQNKSHWDQNRDSMFKNLGPGNADWGWLLQNQKATFVYLMFSQPGVKDFNIESQNRVINKFYDNVAGFSRQRRASDPYPKWLAEQPGYDALRTKQKAALSGQPATPPSPVVVPPTPTIPSQPSQPIPSGGQVAQKASSIKIGSYRENQNLESSTCNLKVTKIVQGSGFDEALINSDSAICFVDGMQRRTDLKTYIRCGGGVCRYTVEQPDGSLFVRDAELQTGNVIKIKGAQKNYSWHWKSP
jgi:hypothetical protein